MAAPSPANLTEVHEPALTPEPREADAGPGADGDAGKLVPERRCDAGDEEADAEPAEPTTEIKSNGENRRYEQVADGRGDRLLTFVQTVEVGPAKASGLLMPPLWQRAFGQHECRNSRDL